MNLLLVLVLGGLAYAADRAAPHPRAAQAISPLVIPLITGGLGLLGSIFGGGKKQTTTTQPQQYDIFGNPWGGTGQGALDAYTAMGNSNMWSGDPEDSSLSLGIRGITATHPPGTTGGDNPLDLFRNQFQDLLGNEIQSYNSGMGAPNFNLSAPHVSASHYSASHASAALIDMLDQAFEAEPNANLREDVYSRLRSGAQAGADDNIRKIMDSARSSGAGPNAPWVQQLESEANKRANQESTQGLTDFFDQYVTAALGRRAAALGENAQLQTGVNEFNAGADNAAGQFNAASNNAASQANAQLGLQSQYYSGSLNNQAEGLHQGQLENLLQALQFAMSPVNSGSTQTISQSGGNAGAYTSLLHDILSQLHLGGGGGGGSAAQNILPYFGGSGDFDGGSTLTGPG